uniref:NADH-ubiquinone oxidoreductase chain 2 n=1 Tax=Habroteleia persimilis TaxID=2496286 RepID=A0A3S8V154_9HYME|nr:NADH dehydrogenase subunit 2 [Habroteleia persimilis]
MLKMKFIFYYTLMMSIFMIITMNNWMSMWLSMELNLYSFITLLMNKNFLNNNNKIMLKYFFIQFLSSIMFLISNLMMNYLNILNILFFNNLLMLSMMMKLGMYPFHHWFIKLMTNIKWMNCFILSNIQKIIPLMIMMFMLKLNKLFIIINIMNSILSTLNGLNQINLKKIMAYSSINHLSWLMIILLFMEKLLIKYLMIYMTINLMIFKWFNLFNMTMLNQIYNFKMNNLLKLIFMMNILSLGGLPPMMGFLMKWFTMFIMKNNFLILINILILMINSMLTLAYYFSITLPMLMMYNKMLFFNKLYKLNNNNFNFIILITIYLSMFFIMYNNIMN